MSAPSFRPPPWWSSIVAGVLALVCLACGALGAFSATTNRPSTTTDASYAKSVIERLAFARPVASTSRERALDVVEAEMRASGAQVQRERGVVSRGDMFVASENV